MKKTENLEKQVKRLQAAVKKELPAGSTKASVTAFLDKKKIKSREYSQYLGASIANCPTEYSFIKGHIEMKFYFDTPDSLSHHIIKSAHGGGD